MCTNMIGTEGTRALAAAVPDCPSLLALKYGAAWLILLNVGAITDIHVLGDTCHSSCRLWDMKSPKDPKAEASIKALLTDRKATAKAASKSAAGTACAPLGECIRLQ